MYPRIDTYAVMYVSYLQLCTVVSFKSLWPKDKILHTLDRCLYIFFVHELKSEFQYWGFSS